MGYYLLLEDEEEDRRELHVMRNTRRRLRDVSDPFYAVSDNEFRNLYR